MRVALAEQVDLVRSVSEPRGGHSPDDEMDEVWNRHDPLLALRVRGEPGPTADTVRRPLAILSK